MRLAATSIEHRTCVEGRVHKRCSVGGRGQRQKRRTCGGMHAGTMQATRHLRMQRYRHSGAADVASSQMKGGRRPTLGLLARNCGSVLITAICSAASCTRKWWMPCNTVSRVKHSACGYQHSHQS